MRDNRDAALALAEFGFKVFPLHSPRGDECDCNRRECSQIGKHLCHERTCSTKDHPCHQEACGSPAKHPRIAGGLTNASRDPAQIAVWWQQWPHANIGIATGAASGIVVMDIDPRHEGDVTLEALLAVNGNLPEGPAVFTGGGGWHYYFKHPGSTVPSRNGQLGAGADIKADGGYVVAPPSVHITGAPYEWSKYDLDTPMPDIPGWLLEKALERAERRWEESDASGPAAVAKGARNAYLASHGGRLRHYGAPQSAIFAFLLALNDEFAEPLNRTEVAKIAASMARNYEPGAATPILGGSPEAKKRGPYNPQPFTAADLEGEDIPDIRWAVDQFMPEGLAIFGGKAKIGKSWKALNISIAVAEGDVVLDVFPTPEADVLMLALEDNKRRLQGRLRKLRPDGRWPARLHLETQWPRSDEGGVDALDAWLGQHPQARLVWIDTLAKFRARPTGKRNDIYAEDYEFGQALQQLALRHGVCIVLITHLNKTLHEDYMDSIQGSAGITGSADTTIYLGRPRGVKGQGAARLRLTGRDIEEQDWSVVFDGKTCQWSIEGEFEEQAVTGETRDLLAIMAKIGNPVTPEDIAAAMNKTRPTAYRLLYRTALDGLIVSHKGKLFTLVASNDEVPVHDVRVSFPSSVSEMSAAPTPSAYKTDNYDSNDKNDNYDNDRENRIDLAEKSPIPIGTRARGIGPMGLEAPEQPCSDCGATAWSLRVGNRWMCDVCAPAIVPIRQEPAS